MRKLLAVLLVLTMAFSLAACTGEKPVEPEVDAPIETPVGDPAAPEETPVEPGETPLSGTPLAKPAEKPAAKPTEKPAEPAEKPTEKPVEKPAEKPAQPTAQPSVQPEASAKTVGQKLLADFMGKAGSASDMSALAQSLIENPIIPFMGATMPVEPGYLSGFGDTEIKGFEEGYMFGPMIGAIAFVGYVFRLPDGADISAFIANLKKNADLRWNICVEAEEMVAGSAGNKVFFVMCPKEFDEE